MGGRSSRSGAASCEASGRRPPTPSPRLRDDPTSADEEQASRLDADDPGLSAGLSFDIDEDVAAPVDRPGRRGAPARRHPARAGGQRSDRDGGRLRPGRLRGGRRPHERSRWAARAISATSAASPPAAGSRTATSSARARAGRSRSCSIRARATSSPPSSTAPTPSRSASATAARCCPRSRRSSPGAAAWPRFVRNRSDGFEARVALVTVTDSPSILLAGMAGSRLPIAVAHGEGRAEWPSEAARVGVRGRAGWSPLASSITAGRSPSTTRRTRTARPAASPRSPRPTAA